MLGADPDSDPASRVDVCEGEQVRQSHVLARATAMPGAGKPRTHWYSVVQS